MVKDQGGNTMASKRLAIAVICMECGKKFTARTMLPECPKCGGSDIDVR
jgi:Zn finger protein HypA/HybF involved in hydrogenase expression